MFSLKGRVAVVTGASSGLGLQMAQGFAEQGADLVIMARRMERLEVIAADFRSRGVRCLPIQCDVLSLNQRRGTPRSCLRAHPGAQCPCG